MKCKSFKSENVSKFEAEIAIHFPHLKDINRRPVSVFSELLICLDCGIAQFTVPKTALGALAKGMRLLRRDES